MTRLIILVILLLMLPVSCSLGITQAEEETPEEGGKTMHSVDESTPGYQLTLELSQTQVVASNTITAKGRVSKDGEAVYPAHVVIMKLDTERTPCFFGMTLAPTEFAIASSSSDKDGYYSRNLTLHKPGEFIIQAEVYRTWGTIFAGGLKYEIYSQPVVIEVLAPEPEPKAVARALADDVSALLYALTPENFPRLPLPKALRMLPYPPSKIKVQKPWWMVS